MPLPQRCAREASTAPKAPSCRPEGSGVRGAAAAPRLLVPKISQGTEANSAPLADLEAAAKRLLGAELPNVSYAT